MGFREQTKYSAFCQRGRADVVNWTARPGIVIFALMKRDLLQASVKLPVRERHKRHLQMDYDY